MSPDARIRVWMFLGVGLVISVAALLGVVALKGDAPEGEESMGEMVRLKVVDEGGAPIPQAGLFVHTPVDRQDVPRSRWSTERAVLTVPKSLTPVDVSIQARGFRSDVVENLAEDRTFVLRMGLLIRLEAVGDLSAIPKPYRLVFQLNPAPANAEALSAEQRETQVELIDTRTAAPSQRLVLPRGEFGFAVWASVAADGLLLPLPGLYAVRWGLLDPSQPTRRVWFSLRERTTATIRVGDDERTQVFEIPIPADELAETAQGLGERLRALGDE